MGALADAPVVTSATAVSATSIEVLFDKAISSIGAVDTRVFSVKAGGATLALTTTASIATDTVTLTVGDGFGGDHTDFTVTYTPDPAIRLRDVAVTGSGVKGFTKAVTYADAVEGGTAIPLSTASGVFTLVASVTAISTNAGSVFIDTVTTSPTYGVFTVYESGLAYYNSRNANF